MNKQKTKNILWGIAAVVVMIVAILFRPQPEVEIPPEILNPSQLENTSAAGTSFELVQLKSKFDVIATDTGLARYMKSNGTTYAELKADILKELTDVKFLTNKAGDRYYMFTGHEIYSAVHTGDEYYLGIAPNSVFNFILSGNQIIPVNPVDMYSLSEYFYNAESMIYDEITPNRIYIFNTQEEADKFQEQYDNGQAVLNGEREREDGQIILDGRLLPCKWTRLSTGINIPMAEFVEYLYTNSYINEYSSSVIVNSTSPEGSNLKSFTFPTNKTPTEFLEGYEVNENMTFVEPEIYEGQIRGTYDIAIGAEYNLPIDSLMAAFGWEVYMDTENKTLIIVTDKSNVSDMFKIKPTI